MFVCSVALSVKFKKIATSGVYLKLLKVLDSFVTLLQNFCGPWISTVDIMLLENARFIEMKIVMNLDVQVSFCSSKENKLIQKQSFADDLQNICS